MDGERWSAFKTDVRVRGEDVKTSLWRFPCQRQSPEGDIIRTIRDHHAHFAHYHTAGVPGRHDLDDTRELNYPPIMKTIAETGYSGYVGHEFIPKGDPVAALEDAYRLCDV